MMKPIYSTKNLIIYFSNKTTIEQILSDPKAHNSQNIEKKFYIVKPN